MIYPHQRQQAQAILREVARAWSVQVDDLLARRRDQYIVPARQVAMYLVRERVGLSLLDLGKLFGRDHTTIKHAVVKAPAYLELPEARRVVQRLADQDSARKEAA